MNLEHWKELLLNDLDSPDLSLDPFQDIDYKQLENFESEFAALVSEKIELYNYGPSVGEKDKTSQIDQNQMCNPEAAQAIPSDDTKPDIGIKSEHDSIDQDQTFFTSAETTQDVSQIRGTKTEEGDNKLDIWKSEYLTVQRRSSPTELRIKQEILQEDEAEDESKTYQNQRKPETAQAIHHAGVLCELHNGAWPRTKVNARTRGLNQQNWNNLPNYRSEYESDASDLKGKPTLGSMTPMTPIEKKRLADHKYRKKKREENINLQNVVRSLSQQNGELNERLQYAENVIEQFMCKVNNQPKFPMKRKAVFELNFQDDENRAEAMKIVAGLPGMIEIDLNVKKRRLKLKGGFDAGAVLYALSKICDTRLVSKENDSSRPDLLLVQTCEFQP